MDSYPWSTIMRGGFLSLSFSAWYIVIRMLVPALITCQDRWKAWKWELYKSLTKMLPLRQDMFWDSLPVSGGAKTGRKQSAVREKDQVRFFCLDNSWIAMLRLFQLGSESLMSQCGAQVWEESCSTCNAKGRDSKRWLGQKVAAGRRGTTWGKRAICLSLTLTFQIH